MTSRKSLSYVRRLWTPWSIVPSCASSIPGWTETRSFREVWPGRQPPSGNASLLNSKWENSRRSETSRRLQLFSELPYKWTSWTRFCLLEFLHQSSWVCRGGKLAEGRPPQWHWPVWWWDRRTLPKVSMLKQYCCRFDCSVVSLCHFLKFWIFLSAPECWWQELLKELVRKRRGLLPNSKYSRNWYHHLHVLLHVCCTILEIHRMSKCRSEPMITSQRTAWGTSRWWWLAVLYTVFPWRTDDRLPRTVLRWIPGLRTWTNTGAHSTRSGKFHSWCSRCKHRSPRQCARNTSGVGR